MKIIPSGPIGFLILALLLPLAACDKSDTGTNNTVITIADMMPRENEISGWVRIGGGDGQWKATGPSELQNQINGGSEIFTNHGFVEAGMQAYSGTVNSQSGVSCQIQIYDQSSEENAAKVFDDPNNVFANALPASNPPSAKAQIRKDLFSWTMKFTKSRYYVLISIMTNEDKGQDVLEVFANNVAGKIP